MRIGGMFSHGTKALLAFRGKQYGLDGDSLYDLHTTVMTYRLGDEVADITTPPLITDPEDEQFWPGQPQRLYDRLPGPKEIVRFTALEGANRHCEPLAPPRHPRGRIFDWLDGYLA